MPMGWYRHIWAQGFDRRGTDLAKTRLLNDNMVRLNLWIKAQ